MSCYTQVGFIAYVHKNNCQRLQDELYVDAYCLYSDDGKEIDFEDDYDGRCKFVSCEERKYPLLVEDIQRYSKEFELDIEVLNIPEEDDLVSHIHFVCGEKEACSVFLYPGQTAQEYGFSEEDGDESISTDVKPIESVEPIWENTFRELFDQFGVEAEEFGF